MQKTLIARVLPAAMLALASGTASAAGFQLLEQNASGIGNAYAGSAAVAENASTIFYNPAGMTQLQAREVSAGLSLVRPSFKFTNQGSIPAGPSSAQDAGDWAALPNAYLSWALNKDLYVGVGMGAPFGLVTEYNRDWVGSAHSIKFDIKTININPSIAWRVNEKVSLGFGLNWQRMEAEYVRRAGTITTPLPLASTFATLDADDDSWGWNVGALFNLSDATKVGVSYRSKIKHELKGSLEFSGTAANRHPLTTGVSASADVELPDIFILSLSHKLDSRWELLGDVSWTGWSSVDKVDIMRTSGLLFGTPQEKAQTLDTDFQDTWRVALGANYQLNDAWKLKFGMAFDETPVKNAEKRLTSLPDNDRIWFSFGGQWKPNKGSALDMGVAYLYVDDTEINNGEAVDAAQRKVRGLVKGEYDSSVWILGAQYSMSF